MKGSIPLKKIITAILILCLLAPLAACADDPATEVPIGQPMPTADPNAINENGSIYFNSNDFGFEFSMPPTWGPSVDYRFDRELPEGVLVSLTVFDKKNLAAGGVLFSICCVQDGAENPYADFKKLGHRKDYDIIIVYPTETQYDETDTANADNYKSMQADIPSVLDNFRVLEDATE